MKILTFALLVGLFLWVVPMASADDVSVEGVVDLGRAFGYESQNSADGAKVDQWEEVEVTTYFEKTTTTLDPLGNPMTNMWSSTYIDRRNLNGSNYQTPVVVLDGTTSNVIQSTMERIHATKISCPSQSSYSEKRFPLQETTRRLKQESGTSLWGTHRID